MPNENDSPNIEIHKQNLICFSKFVLCFYQFFINWHLFSMLGYRKFYPEVGGKYFSLQGVGVQGIFYVILLSKFKKFMNWQLPSPWPPDLWMYSVLSLKMQLVNMSIAEIMYIDHNLRHDRAIFGSTAYSIKPAKTPETLSPPSPWGG